MSPGSRVMVVGTSGAGKSTFARRLSRRLGVEHVELDALNWRPDWRALNTDDPIEFRRLVVAAADGDAWVSDGNYRRVQDVLLARATHLVWLDYPRSVIMRRVISRSFMRASTGRELWPGTGNREHFRRWLDREHPIRWAWDTYADRRRRFGALFEDPSLTRIVKTRISHPRHADALVEAYPPPA